MNKWSVIITKAENGYIVEYDENECTKETVFEATEKLVDIRDMLLFVKEHFGVHSSKHAKLNLIVSIEENK